MKRHDSVALRSAAERKEEVISHAGQEIDAGVSTRGETDRVKIDRRVP